MRKFYVFIIVEAIILLLLASRLLMHRREFIPVVILAVVCSLLAGNTSHQQRQRLFGFAAVLAWLFIVIIILTTGYFWLLLIWPLVWGLFVYQGSEKRQNYADNLNSMPRNHYSSTIKDVTASGKDRSLDDKNEVIDLEELVFHEKGNELLISKSTGNTKIIVPEDVAINLTATTINGSIRIFHQTPVIDEVNYYYQSENYELSTKRVVLKIRVVSGNIEVVHG